MTDPISDIYNSFKEIAWIFGSHGINGECCGDLSFVEFMALKRVYEHADLSIQEIGKSLNFTKSGATRIINRLEEKGYVTRKNSPIDGRVCCVGITDKGLEAVSKIIKNFIAYLEEA
jgi:DNA-binding MarR family transcriptional regulator